MFYSLTVYFSTKGIAVVGVFIQFQNWHRLSLIFWGKWRHRTWGIQCSDCVSMSGLHNGQDLCHIGQEILTLAPCFRIFPYPSPFHPKHMGKDGSIFEWGFQCLMSGWMEHLFFKPDVHPSNGLATACDWWHPSLYCWIGMDAIAARLEHLFRANKNRALDNCGDRWDRWRLCASFRCN
jgi:hypothetical protein